ncbi:hypothetical protein A3B50_01745 [Candidatus Roizmanbacteria bacterium RIFCSPLOWO2_01_FULL_40_42]|uniref:FAD-binding FR-type domain-containing protein n=1 Tax=Candidatus Roizmanbacteria bacterium RIFCSPLOWO2_01_FULL_40_42 TaxID=1802066 RepID=A0A1F7J4G0_9BACT|nr:MAG: hypothetical protein A2779_04065 [Candidatus Roizmanbacteria bacterium RIFCSPHIGHO2_01_FULL_40_98]OGK27253.1 MAG: hypothetical protein A3C31_04390 [Candidatus Roizmanbacteria bacterium RIFCSPHIGHO2_02_FULL_40_53]OGK30875.1 MAG: hypothetical protein A2W49_02650 [Candidatus Roizmanbacteria bacterium RIFCSPHIGHO2_12_41_18]OGK36358.1 MAG: hypothetical protein A3E69_02015 [Candidatus Roizmanbacteria bacterium RIFCSPHIGHO2_12_FULL_40_130]OGK50486.1 MAG: hypothetical protein A3B50_01745 [Candi
MAKHSVKLVAKKGVARETVTFHFEKPVGYTYEPGQFIELTLAQLEGDEKETKHFFTLSSAPYESFLGVTTRIRPTQLKQALNMSKIGQEVIVTDAMGSFLLDETSTPCVFIAGGIGVTPFRSMILQQTHDESQKELVLFYSNRTREDTAYYDEFEQAKKDNLHFKFIPIMTKLDHWTGEKKHISSEMLEKYLPDLNTPVFYSAGPPAMVKSIKELLLSLSIPQEHVKTEEFDGY